MTDKLCAIILDALGPYNIRQLEMDYIVSLYESNEYASDLLTTTGLAHTPISNPMIWGQYHNDEHIWVQNHPYRWTGGIDGFDPILQNEEGDIEFYHREDMQTNFIWDVLDYHGYEVCALGIPLCLPPYYYNAENRLSRAWFPHTPEMLKEHIRIKPSHIQHHAVQDYDFICCSIKVPDQWLHAQGSDIIDREFVMSEVDVLEEILRDTINVLENKGYDWLIFGDHGSPVQGRTANYKSKKLLARHRKEALIIGSTDTVPQYTEDMYPFILDYFDAEDIDEILDWNDETPAPDNPRDHIPMETILKLVNMS